MAISIITIRLLMAQGAGLQMFMIPMGACGRVCAHLRVCAVFESKPERTDTLAVHI